VDDQLRRSGRAGGDGRGRLIPGKRRAPHTKHPCAAPAEPPFCSLHLRLVLHLRLQLLHRILRVRRLLPSSNISPTDTSKATSKRHYLGANAEVAT
jgi:hypothetical protein